MHPGSGSIEESYSLTVGRVEYMAAFSNYLVLPIEVLMLRILARPRHHFRLHEVFFGVLALVALVTSGIGFGAASESTANPNLKVVGTLSMTDPVTKNADPPVCTNALAPLDTDDCSDVTFTGSGSGKVLRLGALSGTDVQAGSLTWTVTTTNPTGYRVHMSNAGTAPLLHGTSASIADMPTSPLLAATAVDDGTYFGVAMGDPASDNQGSVTFSGSPWVNGGQQGELFSGIPVTGMVVAERTSAQTSDPFTATFAVANVPGTQPPLGSYSGTVRLVASAL